MTNVVNVRGCNGAGKTHLARELIAATEPFRMLKVENSWVEVRRKPGTVEKDGLITFVGGYPEGAWTGGADRVQDVRTLPSIIRKVASHSHVFVEGLLLSGLQTLTSDIAEAATWCGAEFVAITLDTSWEDCVANVMKRRAAAGNIKPFDPLKTMKSKYRAVELADLKLQSWGLNTRKLPYSEALIEARRLLCL